MKINILICANKDCLGAVDPQEMAKHFREKGHEVILHEKFCKEVNNPSFESPFVDVKLPTVFAGCSPHVLEMRIKTMFDAPVEIANIREQCLWICDQPEKAEKRCVEVIRLAVSQIEYTKRYRRLDNVLNEVLARSEAVLKVMGPNPFRM